MQTTENSPLPTKRQRAECQPNSWRRAAQSAAFVEVPYPYSFRDDPLIMAFVRRGLGVTISQELVLEGTGRAGIVSRPLEPGSSRRIGLAFSKTTNSVVSRVLLEYWQREFSNLLSPASAAAAAGQGPVQPGENGQPGGEVGHGGSRRGAVGAQAGKGSLPG